MAFWDKLKKSGSFLLNLVPGKDTIVDPIVQSVKAGMYAKESEKWFAQQRDRENAVREKIKTAKTDAEKEKWKKNLMGIMKEENPYNFLYEEAKPVLEKSNAQLAAGAFAGATDIALSATGFGVVKGQAGKLAGKAAAKEALKEGGWQGLKGAGKELLSAGARPSMVSRVVTPALTMGGESAARGYSETGNTEDIGKNIIIGMGEGLIFGEIPGLRSRASRILATGATTAGGAYARGQRDPKAILTSFLTGAGMGTVGEIGRPAGAENTPILGAVKQTLNKYSNKIVIKGEGPYGRYASVQDQPLRLIGKDELTDLLATGNIRPSDGKHVNVLMPDELQSLQDRNLGSMEGRNVMVVMKPEMTGKVKGGGEGVSYIKGPIDIKNIERIILPDRATFQSLDRSHKGFIAMPGGEEQNPEFGKPQNKNEADVMRDEYLAQKSQKENAAVGSDQTAMFNKNEVTPTGGQMDLLSESQADTRPVRKNNTPDEAWQMDYADEHTQIGDNIATLQKQLKTATGADKADIQLKIKDLTDQQGTLEENFISKYQPMQDQKLQEDNAAQVSKMIDSMSPEEQNHSADLIEELQAMGQMKQRYPEDRDLAAEIDSRTAEIQSELSDIGKKSSIKAMPETDVARTMFGEEPSKDILHARNGKLNKAIQETGLGADATDAEMVSALNSKGYDFNDGDEIVSMMKLERDGMPISPEEQSMVKVNDWLDEETFGKMSEEEKFATVMGQTRDQFMRSENVDKNALGRAIKKLGGIKVDPSIKEEITSNVPMYLRNNQETHTLTDKKTGKMIIDPVTGKPKQVLGGQAPDDIVAQLEAEGFHFEDSNELMQALWELPGQKGSARESQPARFAVTKFNDGNIVEGFSQMNKSKSTGVSGIAKGQSNIFDDLTSDYISAQELRRVAAARKRMPILQVGDIPENQMEIMKIARKSDVSAEIKRMLKSDISDTGKIKSSTFQALKDELYGKKMIDTNQAIKEELISYKKLQAEFDKSGIPMSDELQRQYEQKVADRIMSTARGDATPIIDRLEKAGVREDIIKSLRVNNQYPLNTAVRIKREPNGEVSTVISEGLLDHIKQSYKRINKAGEDTLNFKGQVEEIFDPEMMKLMKENGVDMDELNKVNSKVLYDLAFDSMKPEKPRWIKTWSKEGIKKKIASTFTEFEVPQRYFERIGLKDTIYDPIRQGEIAAETMRNESVARLKPAFEGLSKKEREDITTFFAGKQGKTDDIIKAGHTPVTFDMLNDGQKRAVIAWREFNKEVGSEVMKQAERHGLDLGSMEWYFPLYSKKGIEKVGGVNLMDDRAIRKEPFFRSLKEREENVDFNLYEKDAWELANAYINGSSRFLKVGEKTLPIKYLVDSEDFAKVVGAEDQGQIRDWLKEITSPTQATGALNKAFSALRRGAYRSFLGLNPRTVMKQGISYLDTTLVEGVLTQPVTKETKQLSGKLGFSTVTERVPDISLTDASSKYDRAILYGITEADKRFAGGTFNKLMSRELEKIKKEKGQLSNKDISAALQRVGDTVDLSFGGVSPSQRPPIYKTELGKLGLMFTSTLNSRLQYYIQQGAKGIRTKDAAKIAKVMGAFLLAAYAETAISKLSLGADDGYEMAKDVSKAAAGNIPMVGAILFAADSGKYEASAALSNLTDAVEKTATWGKTMESDDLLAAMARWGEVGGVPKQVRKSIEGYNEYGDLRHTIGGKNIDYATQGKGSGQGLSEGFGGSSSSTTKRNTMNSGWKR